MPTDKKILDRLRLLRRVEAIYERYCREGKRPTKAEAEEWLKSMGWESTGLENLLKKWGY